MSNSSNEAEFQFWALTVPKNSTKKLEMENDKSVYHISNATLGNKVSGGRTTVYFNANGKKAPICNLMDKTLENANLDFIVSRSMNASFTTKGPNAVTVSGYIQPPVDESDNDIPTLLDLPLTNGADGEFESNESDTKDEVKATEAAEAQMLESTEDDIKTDSAAAPLEQKDSKKRKLEETESTDGAKAPETKKGKKKRKKKKMNQNTKEEASVNHTNGKGKNTQDEHPAKQPVVEKKMTEKVVNDAQSGEDEGKKEEKLVETPVKQTAAKDSKPKPKSSKKFKKMVDAGKGVTYRVLKKGKPGVHPANKGDKITLLYVGCLKDGTRFDKNLKKGLTFIIGGDEVIPGIELGVIGMLRKEKRRIIIPPEQGYGEKGASEGLIPPNAELHFTVQRK